MALTNEQTPRRKPGRPRKEDAPEVRADLEVARGLQDEAQAAYEEITGQEDPEPELVTYRYIGPVTAWVVLPAGTYEVLPNGQITVADALHLDRNPNFVRVP